jgi:hypothetical protein
LTLELEGHILATPEKSTDEIHILNQLQKKVKKGLVLEGGHGNRRLVAARCPFYFVQLNTKF